MVIPILLLGDGDYEIECPEGPHPLVPFFYSVIALVGFLGNCLVIFIILKYK